MADIIFAGDVRYSNIARELFKNKESKNQAKFLVELQSIMLKHGVTKIDVCPDGSGISSNETAP